MISRNCPICNSSESQNVINSRKDPTVMSFDELTNVFVGLRADQVFFEYKRCNNCELVYAPKYFSDTELSKMYMHMPPNLVGDEKEVVEKTHKGYSSYISKDTKGARSLIELGADLGLVTGEVVSKTGISSGVLIEPNKDVQEDLHKSVGKKDTFKIVDYLSDVTNEENFDLCIAVHVVDHLLHPLEDLKRIRSLVNPEGQIFIVVHNQKSFLARIMGKKWPPYCLQHPQIFDPSSIAKVLTAAGFSEVSVSRTTNWLGLNHSIITLLTLIHVPTRLLRFIPNIAIPVKLGNMIVRAHVN